MAVPRAISGNLGFVIVGGSKVAEISKWKSSLDRGLKEYGAQSGVVAGVGWMKNILGTHKMSGSFEGYFDPNYPIGSICDVDVLITLTLYLNFPTYGIGPPSWISGAARISTRDFSADIDTGDPEPFTYNFQYDSAPSFTNV